MSEPAMDASPGNRNLFPGAVTPDTRPGFRVSSFWPTNWWTFAQALRDEFGYDYLSSVTAVDYYPENKIEVVYHAFRTTGGPAWSSGPRRRATDNPPFPGPGLPGGRLPGARGLGFDGVRFTGHPDLRRMLMWEGFAGHPLRKDWHEPYFEEDIKPLKSRWPEGKVSGQRMATPSMTTSNFPRVLIPESGRRKPKRCFTPG